MVNYTDKSLDVKRLLTMGDLDIRGMAARNETLTADEYFAKVRQFIEDIPQFTSVFEGMTELAGNVMALKSLEEKLGVSGHAVDFGGRAEELEHVKRRLTEIGHEKLNPAIDHLCGLLKAGEFTALETPAASLAGEFERLCNRLSGARLSKKQMAGAAEINTTGLLLQYALESLDREEAERKLRILAVDDVSVVLNSITSALSPYYDVFALKNSSQISQFLAHTIPELFLLDIEMSEVNGFDLVPIIRGFDEHKDTPIIFLTGNASIDNLKDAIAVGACDFITKPVNGKTLIAKIEKWIVRKKTY